MYRLGGGSLLFGSSPSHLSDKLTFAELGGPVLASVPGGLSFSWPALVLFLLVLREGEKEGEGGITFHERMFVGEEGAVMDGRSLEPPERERGREAESDGPQTHPKERPPSSASAQSPDHLRVPPFFFSPLFLFPPLHSLHIPHSTEPPANYPEAKC